MLKTVTAALAALMISTAPAAANSVKNAPLQ